MSTSHSFTFTRTTLLVGLLAMAQAAHATQIMCRRMQGTGIVPAEFAVEFAEQSPTLRIITHSPYLSPVPSASVFSRREFSITERRITVQLQTSHPKFKNATLTINRMDGTFDMLHRESAMSLGAGRCADAGRRF